MSLAIRITPTDPQFKIYARTFDADNPSLGRNGFLGMMSLANLDDIFPVEGRARLSLIFENESVQVNTHWISVISVHGSSLTSDGVFIVRIGEKVILRLKRVEFEITLVPEE